MSCLGDAKSVIIKQGPNKRACVCGGGGGGGGSACVRARGRVCNCVCALGGGGRGGVANDQWFLSRVTVCL